MKDEFAFTISREGSCTAFRYSCAGRDQQFPDFRRFTGIRRELLREFQARRQAPQYAWNFEGTSNENTILNPDERLIKQALSAGLLQNTEGEIFHEAEGVYRCTLRIEDVTSNHININPVLQDESGIIITSPFYTVSACLAAAGNHIYSIEDLGVYWADTDRIRARLLKTEMPAFLSLMFSIFSSLNIIYEGWTVRHINAAQALPALLFMEIDHYGYLHVRPISFLHGFPPLFLENENIISAVEISETDKTLGIAEVVFPEPPEEIFRNMLGRGNREAVKKSVYEENGRFIIAPDFAAKFFGEHIIDLSGRFVLLETQVLKGYKLKFTKPHVRLSMGRGIDYLSGKAEVELEGERFSFARFMTEYHKTSYITLSDGSRAFPDKRTMDRLERLLSQIRGKETEVELSYFDIPLLLSDDSIEIEGAAWENARPFFTNYNTIADRRGSWSLENGNLRPYQEYGVRWLDYLQEFGMGACLADEMGLGKTIQVIALLRTLYAGDTPGKCLILCPKTLVFNWAAELDRFAPELPYYVHYGPSRDSTGLEGNESVILSTYSTLRRDIEVFKQINFFYIILDESQNIKNQSTQTTAAVLSLQSGHKLALSGTPVENNLGELYSLFRFLNPNFFGSEKLFNQRYLHPIQDSGDKEALRDLKARINPFMLRRVKRDVLKDLPEKSEETAYIELEEDHLAVYHRRRQEYKELINGIISKGEYPKASFIVFKALSELRRLASVPEADGEYAGPSAKRLYLRDMVAELVQNDHKCLIFTNFLATVDLASEDLAAMGISNLTMTGATGDRLSLVRRFQTDSSIKAFIMTLKTGGSGLNLTAADYIFILDPWWNYAAETQAIDRSHRIGQSNPVFCYRLIAKDTIEERIMELQKRKANLAGALLSDDAGAMKTLTPEDVAYLVGDSSGDSFGKI